jgi:MoaA/NifB/PqqE/SkfB family radical SAM enzyme
MDKKTAGIIISPCCSLACVFCGGHNKSSEQEIKKQELNVYKNIQDFKQKGFERIAISGSDPIEYEEIIELIKYIKTQGFKWVQLSTHGNRMSNPVFLKKLINSGVDRLRIPIYGSNAKVHDSVTRTKGSFNKVMFGIRKILKDAPQINIQISCLVLKQNKNDLLNVVDFITNLGIENFYFSIPCLEEEPPSFYIPIKDLSPILNKLYKHVLKVNDNIRFLEIPFCVFGEFNLKNIGNMCYPPDLGKYNQPPERLKTSTLDLPSYRVKKKIEICKGCKAFNSCDGFFVNDIDKFGTGNLKKI